MVERGGGCGRADRTTMAADVPGSINSQSSQNGSPTIATLQSRLVRLDRLGRQIDGGAEPLSDEPEWTTRLRETRVHDVLLWLADRTWEDHWYNERSSRAALLLSVRRIEPAQRCRGPSRGLSRHPQAQERLRLQGRARASTPRPGFDRLDQRAERVGLRTGSSRRGACRGRGRRSSSRLPVRDSNSMCQAASLENRTASRQSDGPSIDFKFFSPILTEAEQEPGEDRLDLHEAGSQA